MGPLPPWTLGLASLTPAPLSSAARVLSIVVHVSLGIGAVPSRIRQGQMVHGKEKAYRKSETSGSRVSAMLPGSVL